MTLLEGFPPEILAIIFDGAASVLILPLIMCGNATLNRKLYSSISNIDLEDTRKETKSCFPNIISDLANLRHLSINRGMNPLKLHDTATKLRNEKLLITLRITSSQETDLRSLCSDLSLFSCLTTVSYTSSSEGHLEDIKHLPASLTDLTTPTMFFHDNLEDPVFSTLPRGLLAWRSRLVLMWTQNNDDVHITFRDPPPMLHTLNVSADASGSSTFAFLPRSLTDCHFHHSMGQGSFGRSLILSLPPGLIKSNITVSYEDLQVNPIAMWPPIVNLSVTDAFDAEDANFVANLPRSLTDLSFFGLGCDIEDAELLPKSLTSLDLCASRISTNTLRNLPRTMKKLGAEWNSDCFPGDLLPPHLTDLEIRLSNTFDCFTIESTLPPSLVSLALYMKERPETVRLVDFNYEGDSMLHLRMDRFKFEKSEASEPVAPKLPPKLQTFRAGSWAVRHFGDLPRSLTDLQIRDLPLSINAMIPMDTDVFAPLPIGLTRLSMGASRSNIETVFSSRSFESLKNLKFISLLRMGSFETPILKNNWPRLRSIKLYVYGYKPEDQVLINPNWERAQIFSYYQEPLINIKIEEPDVDW